MKPKALLIAIALILGISGSIKAQTNMFEKFSNSKNITTVFVSKSLLSMMPNMDMGGVNVKSLSKKLEQLEIYTGESKDAMKLMKAEMNALAKNKSYEVLMTVKDDDEHVIFYAQKDKGDSFKDLIMFVSDSDDCTIIRIVGHFTTEDIQNVIKNNRY